MAGQNISINPVTNVISAVNGAANYITSVLGPHLSVATSGPNAGELSINLSSFATQNYVDTTFQPLLAQGQNITIANNTISATNFIDSVGQNLDVTNGELTVDLTSKEDTFAKGHGLAFSNGTLSVSGK